MGQDFIQTTETSTASASSHVSSLFLGSRATKQVAFAILEDWAPRVGGGHWRYRQTRCFCFLLQGCCRHGCFPDALRGVYLAMPTAGSASRFLCWAAGRPHVALRRGAGATCLQNGK